MSKHRVTVEIPEVLDSLVIMRIGDTCADLPERIANLRAQVGSAFRSFRVDVCGRLVVDVVRGPTGEDIADAVANGLARVVSSRA